MTGTPSIGQWLRLGVHSESGGHTLPSDQQRYKCIVDVVRKEDRQTITIGLVRLVFVCMNLVTKVSNTFTTKIVVVQPKLGLSFTGCFSGILM